MPNFLKNSVALRVYAAVCFPILLTAGLVLTGLWVINSLSYMAKELDSAGRRAVYAERSNMQIYNIVFGAHEIFVAKDSATATQYAGTVHMGVENLKKTLTEWEGLIHTDQQLEFANAKQQFSAFIDIHTQVVMHGVMGKIEDAKRVGATAQEHAHRDKLILYLSSMIMESRREVEALGQSIDARIQAITLLFVAAVIAGVAACMIFAVVVTRRTIVKPLQSAHQALARLSDGDLQTDIPASRYPDEIGQMLAGLATFKQNAVDLERSRLHQAELAHRNTEHNAAMSQLTSAIKVAVDVANHGDYSYRIALNMADPALEELARGVNSVLMTVETGLQEATSILSSVAVGDLTRRMDGHYAGAFAQLKDGTNAAADRLEVMIGQIDSAVRTLRGATEELMSGSKDLSERTMQQASTIEETTTSLEQFARTVKSNAGRAVDAAGLASSAQSHAEKGGAVIQQVQEAMTRIDESSSRITDVIALIDDIAFQTNLLALNASVEAARAGDAGRGFAVVAQEVRRLAQRAAEASSEVKGLVGQSQREVRGGVSLVGRASSTLLEIVSSVKVVTGMMHQIASDSRVQAETVSELSQAVRSMDEITQANSFLVEETNGAIAATKGQVVGLSSTLAEFTTRTTQAKAYSTAA